MPRITAATVAEHRSNQRGALLDAARELLLTVGADAVTPAAVGRSVGLARSSVYKYFPSGAAILAELVETSFTDWATHIHDAVSAQQRPDARIDAYVRSTIRLGAAGRHRIAGAVAAVELPPACRERIGQLHRMLTEPLLVALRERGDPRPGITAALIQGALDGAIRLIDAGEPADEVLVATAAILGRPQPTDNP